MAHATQPAAAAAAMLVVLLFASPGARAWDWGESCVELCMAECAKQSAEVEERKKLNTTQCLTACNVGCPIAYLTGHGGKPEDFKEDGTRATPVAKSAAAVVGKDGPAHYACLLIHAVVATLWYY